MAAELIEAGVDVHGDLPPPVRGHALRASSSCSRARWPTSQRFDDGRLTFTRLTRDDFSRAGRRGELLRGHHRPPALGRGHEGRRARRASCLRRRGRGQRKVSLRATDGTRRRLGHRPRAAAAAGTARRPGFTTEMSEDELIGVPARAGRRAAVVDRRARLLRRQAAGEHLARRVARVRRPLLRRAQGRPRRHAGPVRHRAAARPASGARTRVQRFLMALPKQYVPSARARRGLDHRRPGGRDHRDRARPAARPGAADRAHRGSARRSYSAVRVQAAGPTSARATARSSSVPEREVDVYRFEQQLAPRTIAPSSSSSARRGRTCAR